MKASVGALWREFKSFAFKGNMIDLAVAVVIGAAFGKVVTAMVDDVVMPAISYAVTAVEKGKEAGTSLVSVASPHNAVGTAGTTAPPAAAVSGATPPAASAAAASPGAATPTTVVADPTKVVQFDLTIGRFKVGDFIGSLLNFVIVAFAVFIMIVKLLGSMMQKVAGGAPEPGEPTSKECPFCLSSISIKAKKCSQCTADLPIPACPRTTQLPPLPSPNTDTENESCGLFAPSL